MFSSTLFLTPQISKFDILLFLSKMEHSKGQVQIWDYVNVSDEEIMAVLYPEMISVFIIFFSIFPCSPSFRAPLPPTKADVSGRGVGKLICYIRVLT